MVFTSQVLATMEGVLKGGTVEEFDSHLMVLGLLQGLDNDVYRSLEVFQNAQDFRIEDCRVMTEGSINKILKMGQGRVQLLDGKVVSVKESKGSFLVGKDSLHLVGKGFELVAVV